MKSIGMENVRRMALLQILKQVDLFAINTNCGPINF